MNYPPNVTRLALHVINNNNLVYINKCPTSLNPIGFNEVGHFYLDYYFLIINVFYRDFAYLKLKKQLIKETLPKRNTVLLKYSYPVCIEF